MRYILTGLLVFALAAAALPALAQQPVSPHQDLYGRLRGYEAGDVPGVHPATPTFALIPAGPPAGKANYKARPEGPTAKQLDDSGRRGGK